MDTIVQFKIGAKSFFKAIPFIFKNQLGWFFIFPILFNIILFIIGLEAVSKATDFTTTYLKEQLTSPDVPEWIGTFLTGFVWILFKILFFFIFAYLGGFITLILLSPVLAVLSEKVDQKLTGKSYPFNISQLIKDILRGITIAVRNMALELVALIALFVFSFIPIIGWSSPIIMFLVSSYFYGFAFIDYSSERQKLNISESVQFVRNNKGVAITNGTIYSFFLLIPFVGMMLSGFVAIISVVAATIAVHEITTYKHG